MATDREFQRWVMERMLDIHRDVLEVNKRSLIIMGIVEDMQASVAALKQELKESQDDVARQLTQTNTTLGVMQAQSQRIADLIAAGGASVEQLTALKTDIDGVVTGLRGVNVQRDQADADLAAGTQANIPG